MRIIKYGGKKFASKQAREERELLFPFVCIVFQCKSNENGQERRREARRATEELERINEAKPRAARMATVKNAARAQVRGAQPESGEKWSPHREWIVAKMGETSRANERKAPIGARNAGWSIRAAAPLPLPSTLKLSQTCG